MNFTLYTDRQWSPEEKTKRQRIQFFSRYYCMHGGLLVLLSEAEERLVYQAASILQRALWK